MHKNQRVLRIAAAAATIAAVVSSVCYLRRKYRISTGKGTTSTTTTTNGKITELWVYPVKSCAGVLLPKASIGQYGMEYDREWVVARVGDNAVVTQRDQSRMKLIQTALDVEKKELTLFTADETTGSVTVPLTRESFESIAKERLVELEKWGLKGTFAKENAEVAAWLSTFLGQEVYLARCYLPRNPNETKFKDKIQSTDRVLGHDFSSLHVATEQALQWIQETAGDSTLNFQRFRPNIVLETDQPFPEEDTWHRFTVGDLSLRTAKGCTRCSMPTINDEAVLHPEFQPTKTLSQRHANNDGKPVFGLSVFHDNQCEVSVGDTLKVTKRY